MLLVVLSLKDLWSAFGKDLFDRINWGLCLLSAVRVPLKVGLGLSFFIHFLGIYFVTESHQGKMHTLCSSPRG